MNAPKPAHLVEVEVEAVKNATSAGRLATLLVLAPNRRAPGVLTTVVEVTVVAQATTLSEAEVEARRPGMFGHQF